MRIHVRLFASYAAAAGFRERILELPDGACAADVLAAVKALAPRAVGPHPLMAVNRTHAPADAPVHDGDEVAIFPPVSGGSGAPARAIVTTEPLDASALAESVRHPSCGALVVFEGMVRDHSDGPVAAIEYEAYAEMADACLDALVAEVLDRHPSARLAVAHRLGLLRVGETSVVVACAAPHRRQAFAAARLAMDRVKESLPAWKREVAPDGASRWR